LTPKPAYKVPGHDRKEGKGRREGQGLVFGKVTGWTLHQCSWLVPRRRAGRAVWRRSGPLMNRRNPPGGQGVDFGDCLPADRRLVGCLECFCRRWPAVGPVVTTHLLRARRRTTSVEGCGHRGVLPLGEPGPRALDETNQCARLCNRLQKGEHVYSAICSAVRCSVQ
jgi:hypothetical protein